MEPADLAEPEPVWTIQYVLDEPRFVELNRALALPGVRDAIATLATVARALLAHLFLAVGLLVFVFWLTGKHGSNGPIPWGAAIFNLAVAAGCAYYLVDFVSFRRARLRRLFRKNPLAGEKLVYTLSPSRFGWRNKLAEGSLDWSLVSGVTELNDGFVVSVSNGAQWVPRDAADTDFTHISIAEFLRTRVRNYAVLNRTAGAVEMVKSGVDEL